jgi:hypothetical protein
MATHGEMAIDSVFAQVYHQRPELLDIELKDEREANQAGARG